MAKAPAVKVKERAADARSLNFEEVVLGFAEDEALQEAVNGLSTKSKERGYGLSSNLTLFTKGLHGEIFIVSRKGALYIQKNQQKLYKLQGIHALEGTLISVRIPFPAPQVNIYEYLSH